MPYIPKENRHPIAMTLPTCPGEIQYIIAKIVSQYVVDEGLCYQTLNDVMGALSGAQMEFYRRHVAPYEDQKIEENGDI